MMKVTSQIKIVRRIADVKYARKHSKRGARSYKAERRAINKAIRQEGRKIINQYI